MKVGDKPSDKFSCVGSINSLKTKFGSCGVLDQNVWVYLGEKILKPDVDLYKIN